LLDSGKGCIPQSPGSYAYDAKSRFEKRPSKWMKPETL